MWKKTHTHHDKNSVNSVSSDSLIYKNLHDNVAKIREDLGNSSDLIIRFIPQINNPYAMALVHIDSHSM